MARSTCDNKREAPKGMMKFEVIRTAIKDSVGQYCLPGDMAILDKKLAKDYLDKNLIKVALPEFDDDDKDDGDTSDEDGENPPQRAKAAPTAVPRVSKGS